MYLFDKLLNCLVTYKFVHSFIDLFTPHSKAHSKIVLLHKPHLLDLKHAC